MAKKTRKSRKSAQIQLIPEQTSPQEITAKAEQIEECNTTPPAKPGVKKIESKVTKDSRGWRTVLCMLIVCLICVSWQSFENFPREMTEEETQEETAEQISPFRNKLLAVVEAKNAEEGKTCVIDERYYNEDVAAAFISVMHDIDVSEIREIHIRNFFDALFLKLNEDDVVNLIQKDKFTLLEECEDKTKMNRLDYLFIGLSNDEIMARSRGFYLSQNNPEYKNIPYGSSNLSLSGCGPVSLTIAMNYAAEDRVTYLESVVNWANENDMYEKNSGTRWSLIRNYPPYMGMECDELYIRSAEKLREALQEDGVIIASMGEGSFTDNGHFIVLTGISGDEVSVFDCASIYRSLKKWDIELIFEEANNYYWRIYK